jgi:hypothetical protein
VVVATLLWTPNQGNILIDTVRRDMNKTLEGQEVENAEDMGNKLGIVKDVLKVSDWQVRELWKRFLVRMLPRWSSRAMAQWS